MIRVGVVVGLVLVAGSTLVLVACGSGGDAPSGGPSDPEPPYAVEQAVAPTPCGQPDADLTVSALFSLVDARAGVVRVDATSCCNIVGIPEAAVLVETPDSECHARLEPLPLSDVISEISGFQGEVRVTSDVVRLTVVIGWEIDARDVACGPGGCLDLALSSWAISESVVVRRGGP